MKSQYYHNKESVKEYIQLAKDVNGAPLIKRLKKHLPSQQKLLELGSGPGTDWNLLKEEYDTIGSDISQEFLKHLIQNNPKGKFIELDAVTIDIKEYFDGIYTNKVLHHLTDMELLQSIKRQHQILNPKGIICHSFWKGEGTEMFKGMFVNYHSEDDLRNFFSSHFEILVLEDYKEFECGDSILLIGKKKESPNFKVKKA